MVTRRSLHRYLLAIVAVGALSAGSVLTSSTPAHGQANLVTVLVRTDPPLPDAGDDVTVAVRIAGCPPGVTDAEAYLSSDDGVTATATLMARAQARTSLLWRTRAIIELPDALEGWYGVRVVCGSFRPARGPMANTYFLVGTDPTKEIRLGGTEVVEGGTLPLSGTGCPGSAVEYSITQAEVRLGPFIPQGRIPVNPDGTWSAEIEFPEALLPGPAEVRARCLFRNSLDLEVEINYGGSIPVRILRAPPPPLPG